MTTMNNYKKIIFAALVPAVLLNGAACMAQDSVDIQDLVVLSEEEATTEEILGPKRLNIHPFISIQAEYTDNMYSLNVDEQTNFIVNISPGIWFITPKAERLPVRLSSYNTAVGGSRFSLPSAGSFDRFQAYLHASMDYKTNSGDSNLDYTAWDIEGMFQYALPANISFRVMDKFVSGRDRIDIGSFEDGDFSGEGEDIKVSSPSLIRDFISNQLRLFLNLDMSEKFTLNLDYANYYLDFDKDINDWLDRTDNALALYLYYHHSPKTSFFAQLSQAEIDYDSADYNDNTSSSIAGGLRWQGTVKTSLMVKGGYEVKKYDSVEDDEVSDFTMETMISYLATDKTKISFSLVKALEETDTRVSKGKETISSRFNYDQEFSERFRGYVQLRVENYDYEAFDRIVDNRLVTEPRHDLLYGIKPALQYDFSDWLMTELSYSFEDRNSNIDIFDFTAQTIFLSLNAAL